MKITRQVNLTQEDLQKAVSSFLWDTYALRVIPGDLVFETMEYTDEDDGEDYIRVTAEADIFDEEDDEGEQG